MHKSLCVIVCGALCGLALMGCCQGRRPHDQGAIVRGPVPSYESVAEAYNARVARLERLSGSVALNIKARGNEGDRITEQVEGNLQIALPTDIALRIDKVGQTVFYLGSNAERYWWFDLTKEPKSAAVGEHARADLATVTSFGVPVHPLDLIEVLAVRPLPAARGGAEMPVEPLAWSADGRMLGLTLNGRWGLRRFWLNPDTFEPMEIELLTDSGEAVVRCTLSGMRTIEVDDDAAARPFVAQRFFIDLPLQDAQVVITLEEARNPAARMRRRVFDLDSLLKYYNIEHVMNIDQPAAPTSSQGVGR